MNISSLEQKGICDNCGEEVPGNVRFCPTCRTDAGAPNVRACEKTKNIEALTNRFKGEREKCEERNCRSEFEECSKKIKEESGVVITMPTNVARNLFSNPKETYTNYDRLVGSGSRTPAE